MSDSSKPSFVFEGTELLASALHAQLLVRRRGTFEHDLKNVIHGLLSGTELLGKALATNSARIPPAECLSLLQQQLGRAQTTLHHMLAEIAPAAAPTADLDLMQLIDECVHDLRHQLQRFKLDAAIAPHLKVRAQRPHLKNALLGALLEAMDHAPLGSTLTVSARAEDDRVLLDIRHAVADAESPGVLAALEALLRAEGAGLTVTGTAGERRISLQLPVAQEHEDAAGRLVIVDANHDAADSLVMLVQLEGFQAQAAYDVESALQLVRAKAPSAVIVDIDGSIDSAAFIAELRAEAGAGTHIVGMTHSMEPQLADLDAQVRKPLDPKALHAILTAR
jgi:DNA-binding NarL/FixJ family response regulator